MSEEVLEFPEGPTDGQTITWSFEHTGGSAENNIMTRVWSWNDFRSAWISNKSKSSGLGIRDELAAGPSAAQLFVLKSGDSMHGTLNVPILQATGDAGIVRGKLGDFSSGNITALTGNTSFFNQGRFLNSLTVDNGGILSAAAGVFSASLTASSFFSTDATITDATITDATITDATITDATITDATITNIFGNNANFSGSLTAGNIRSNALLSGNNANFSGSLTAGNIRSNALLSGINANFSGSLTADKAFRSSSSIFEANEFVTLQHVLSLIPGPIITDYTYNGQSNSTTSSRGRFKIKVSNSITLGVEFGRELYSTFSWSGGNGYKVMSYNYTFLDGGPYILSATLENPYSNSDWAGFPSDKCAQIGRNLGTSNIGTQFTLIVQGAYGSNNNWSAGFNGMVWWFVLGRVAS